MATWRKRDLDRRRSERQARVAPLLRGELLLALLALVVAVLALWQAMAAQGRADVLAHDLGVANARLRSLTLAATPTPVGGEPHEPAQSGALPPLPPMVSPQAGGDNPGG